MKTIGIIGAMEEEITLLKPKLEMISAKNIVGMDFYMGKLRGKSAVIVKSGIGKVNAGICTQVLCDMYGVDCVVNIGVAGALSPELEICDVVISGDVVQHDFDATAFGYELGFIPRMPVSCFEADPELIDLAKQACCEVAAERKIVVGRVASGDVFVSGEENKSRIYKVFNAACTEMEGAAIGQVCYLNKIPFVIIRAMSDAASGDAKVEFNNYVQEAAKQSCDIVETMLRLM